MIAISFDLYLFLKNNLQQIKLSFRDIYSTFQNTHIRLQMLRVGNKNDFDGLYDIYMHPTVNPYLSFEIMSKEEFVPIFDELYQSGILYIYENADGQILSTCIVERLERRCIHTVCLSTLATNPEYHRQGIGTKFLRQLLDEIRQDKQIKRIELYAEDDNQIGLNFYKKFGFEEEGRMRKAIKRANDEHFVDELILAMIFD